MKPAARLAIAAALLAALTMPDAAIAGKGEHVRSATLKGEVLGQPWRVGAKTAVPVVLSAASARRAKLHSPVGILLLSAKTVAAPAGTRVQPALLRPADRVKTRARLKRAHRRSPYWRIATRKLTVTRRSKTPSAAELQALIAQLRADLAALSKGVGGLAGYTKQGFGNLETGLAALRAEIEAIKTRLAALGGEMPALRDQLAGDLAGMQAAVDSLSGDLTDLATAVGQLGGTVGALPGGGLLGGG